MRRCGIVKASATATIKGVSFTARAHPGELELAREHMLALGGHRRVWCGTQPISKARTYKQGRAHVATRVRPCMLERPRSRPTVALPAKAESDLYLPSYYLLT